MASGTGADIDFSRVPVYPVTQKVCARYGIDVLGLISSGSMIITARDGAKVVAALEKAGVRATMIGTVTQAGVCDVSCGSRREITPYRADELYKVLER